MQSSALGTLRASWLVCVCCMGSFLFAYDTGIIGGILTLKSFARDFNYAGASKTYISSVNANAASILQGGAFFGCFFIWPIASRFGRRWSLVVASVVFELGTILQVVKSGSLACFYVGRVISGLGVGASTVLIPIYAAEMSPKEIRGKLGSCFQLFFAMGVMVSYWVDYGVSADIEPSTRQWQIPIAIQFIPGGLVGLGMLTIKESSRWLVKRGRNQEALESLIWVRGGKETPDVRAEMAEMVQGVEEEIRATEGFTWKELWLPANRYRIGVAVSLQLCQQLTGNTSLAYFAPQIFSAIAGGTSTTDVFITGFFGVVKFFSVLTFVVFVIDNVGRKTAFMGGAFAMGTFMLIIACIVATHPPSTTNPAITGPGIAAVAMVYAEAMAFNFSWGPIAWLYIGEIFPTRIREIGVASGAASQWLFNFMMSQVTPFAITNIGWRTFLMFAIFNYAIIAYSWFVLKETSGKSLEEMETVFNSEATKFDVEATRRAAAEGGAKDVDQQQQQQGPQDRQLQQSTQQQQGQEQAQPAFSPSQVSVVFVLGGPGAGKGTQSERLVTEYGFTHLSAGDLLREEQSRESADAETIRSYIKNGEIIPMEITVRLLQNAIKADLEKRRSQQKGKASKESAPESLDNKITEVAIETNHARVLIDGFPRKMDQAVYFVDKVCPCQFVLFFDTTEEVMRERLMDRGKTSGRSDDNEDSIRKRFRTYTETSRPVIDYFAESGKTERIDATPTPEVVYQHVEEVMARRGFAKRE